jgi:hypothetical protein
MLGTCSSRCGSCLVVVHVGSDWARAVAQAACCIVSCRSNEDFDAYVLSESSLFVYPDRLVLKTCGTTALLAAVPMLLDLATSLDMRIFNFKYSRASFLFPETQVTASITSFFRLQMASSSCSSSDVYSCCRTHCEKHIAFPDTICSQASINALVYHLLCHA